MEFFGPGGSMPGSLLKPAVLIWIKPDKYVLEEDEPGSSNRE
jgi:hypothetical protein